MNQQALDDTTKELIREAYKNLGDNTPGFRPRAAQRHMIGGIARHLGAVYPGDKRPDGYHTPIFVVEAGTGTGKTFAYALAMLVIAKQRGKTLIISTGTVALQEQIVAKDLPDLQARSGLDFKFVLAKGRRRYVCPSRLVQRTDGSAQGTFETYDTPTAEKLDNIQLFGRLREAFDSGAWNGDRDTWDVSLADSAWSEISTDRHGCTGGHCSMRALCPFFTAREAMEDCEVIVANHDLVLSDMMLGGGVILPSPGESILVLDEGHHLADKAASHGSNSHWVGGAREWINRIDKVIQTVVQALPGAIGSQLRDHFGNKINDAIHELNRHLNILMGSLINDGPFSLEGDAKESVWRFPHGAVPEAIQSIGENILPVAADLHKVLTQTADALRLCIKDGSVAASMGEALLPDLGFFMQRIENLYGTWNMMLAKTPRGSAPMARWITAAEKGSQGIDYEVCASTIDVGPFLNEKVWNPYAGIVVTSATLTALGKFNHYFEKTGLYTQPEAITLKLESPFDYAKQGVLDVPDLSSTPKDQVAHTQDIIRWANGGGIHSSEGTLFLFSSYRQMSDVYAELNPTLQDIALLQGQLPKSLLIQRHKDAIDAGRGSLLMGVDSMGEGIDLPGKFCTHVVIAKIPFAVPTSPVEEATSEWIEAQGKSPFMEIAVPAASTKLIQRVGRLLRTEDDHGRITILDRRLICTRYGQAMLDALPPMKRTIST